MKKADHSTDRGSITRFQQIVNVGPAFEEDFRVLGIKSPQGLIGRDPWQLYRKLCTKTKTFHDPCVLDTFLAIVDFMNGNPPKIWWKYTSKRKSEYSQKVEKLKKQLQRAD